MRLRESVRGLVLDSDDHVLPSMAAATVLKRFTGSDSFGAFYARSTPLAADPTTIGVLAP